MAQTKKPFSSRMFRLVAGLVFCWMLLLNCLTPYLADDYTFAYAFDTGERLHSLPQLISSLVFHYHEWSGRVIVKFFAQGFTMFPKLLFNVCNAGMFMALGLVLYKLAVGRRSQKADWLALALIYAALWEISPVFGQTNLWMCGAAVRHGKNFGAGAHAQTAADAVGIYMELHGQSSFHDVLSTVCPISGNQSMLSAFSAAASPAA